MRRQRRYQPSPGYGSDFDQRVNDAITDLSAYALRLDMERHRLDDRLVKLSAVESLAAERRALLRELEEIVEELAALRGAIGAFQEQFSPNA